MVSSVIPGTAGAGALGVDQRYARPTPAPTQQREKSGFGDRVELGETASWSAARESVRAGLAQVQQALAIGHEAQAMLVQVRDLAQGDAEDAQTKLDAVLAGFSARVSAALQGALLLNGETLAVQAEPGAPAVEVAGVDLALKQDPAETDIIQIRSDARADDANLARQAQTSLDRLQAEMERLLDAARSLEAHQGFLGAVEGAGGVRHDLDADAARLLALQVRQGLDAAGGGAIANAEPQAVLSLFRA